MQPKTVINILHSSHLDLFWMGCMQTCLDWGSDIIADALSMADENSGFHFVIETVRFAEYFVRKFPEKKELLRKLVKTGQIEICGDYTDRMENQHDGESIARNLAYGKRVLRDVLGIETRIAYHPDIPGFGEQVPQIFRKSGVDYTLTARGFHRGARFHWAGLDGSKVVMYDFPVHYSYYSIEAEVLARIGEVQKNVCSRDIILSCGAGDLGAADTFVRRMPDNSAKCVKLTSLIAELSEKYPEYEFRMCNVEQTLRAMAEDGLPTLSGESPPRWGLSSGREIKLFQLDRRAAALLLQAEKFSTVSGLLGMPVNVSYPQHPLRHVGSSGGRRKYPELDMHPVGLQQHLELAWRMLFVSQDHNYGGVDGAQSMFDNYRYKEAAVRIADDIRRAGLERIASRVQMDGGSVVVFNPMNWEGMERVAISGAGFDPSGTYRVTDAQGISAPLVHNEQGWSFFARGVPPFGYKAYRIEDGAAGEGVLRSVSEGERYITVKNPWYILKLDKKRGVISCLRDRESGREIIQSDSFLSFTAYRDTDDSAAERTVVKPLLDESVRHVRDVRIIEDSPIATVIEMITEIMNAKVCIRVSLAHGRKQLSIRPVIYWPGLREIQLRMDMSFAGEVAETWYGVAYGAQRKGDALEKDLEIKPGDEIHPDLYRRYREVQQWFALESGGHGVCVGSTHSAYDFDGSHVSAVMARTVKNCGEWDVWYANEGVLDYDFRITSYQGCWKDHHAYRSGFETINPLVAVETALTGCDLSSEDSFVTAPGVMTAFKKADHGNGIIMRVFNNTPAAEDCEAGGLLGLEPEAELDFEERALSAPTGRLTPFEIKTLRMKGKGL